MVDAFFSGFANVIAVIGLAVLIVALAFLAKVLSELIVRRHENSGTGFDVLLLGLIWLTFAGTVGGIFKAVAVHGGF